MFQIEFTPEAIEDMRSFRKPERRRIVEEISSQLRHFPAQETRNKKKLRPNKAAEWELRVDPFRIFYDVEEEERFVKIEAVGYKRGSTLFIRGEEYKL